MKVFPRIDIPGHSAITLMETYNMSPSDIEKAFEAYIEHALNCWDAGIMTFFQFLEMDMAHENKFTHTS